MQKYSEPTEKKCICILNLNRISKSGPCKRNWVWRKHIQGDKEQDEQGLLEQGGKGKVWEDQANSLFIHWDGFENNNVLVSSSSFFKIQVAIEDCNDFSLKSNAGKPLWRLPTPTVQKHCVPASWCNGDKQKKHFKERGDRKGRAKKHGACGSQENSKSFSNDQKPA